MAQFRTTAAATPKTKEFSRKRFTDKCRSEKVRATKKAYYERNKARISERAKNRPDKSERNLRCHLKSYYGLSLEDYKVMKAQQNDCCAICLRHESKFKRRLHVDHCHSTHKVRSLLCNRCNLLIGHAKDCANLLRVAADYLEAYNGAI